MAEVNRRSSPLRKVNFSREKMSVEFDVVLLTNIFSCSLVINFTCNIFPRQIICICMQRLFLVTKEKEGL